jgi:signal transduction histidine kinase
VTPLQTAFWRSIAVFRAVGVVYAVAVAVATPQDTRHPVIKAALLAGMALWSVVIVSAGKDVLLSAPWMIADLAIALALIGATRIVDTHEAIVGGAPTLPGIWVTSTVLLVATTVGARIAAAAGLLIAIAGLMVRGEVVWRTVNNGIFVILAGALIGYLARIALRAEAQLAHATAVASAQGERERLGREIHDSVLQALAFIVRRGREIGGDATELAELAKQEEQSLRRLVTTPVSVSTAENTDLTPLLSALANPRVHLSAPAEPVLLPAHVAREVRAAVKAALDNVTRHAGAGAQAFVLVEEEPEQVVVSVRDTGRGVAPARLLEAERAGRMGFAQSIRGRIESLGGKVTLVSGNDEGTEVELHVPRRSR